MGCLGDVDQGSWGIEANSDLEGLQGVMPYFLPVVTTGVGRTRYVLVPGHEYVWTLGYVAHGSTKSAEERIACRSRISIIPYTVIPIHKEAV